jgi:hypothetical protein
MHFSKRRLSERNPAYLPIVGQHEDASPKTEHIPHSLFERARVSDELVLEIEDRHTRDVRLGRAGWIRASKVADCLRSGGLRWDERRGDDDKGV